MSSSCSTSTTSKLVEKPSSSFFLFLEKISREIRLSDPKMKQSEVTRKAQILFDELNENERKKYDDMAQKQREEYAEEEAQKKRGKSSGSLRLVAQKDKIEEKVEQTKKGVKKAKKSSGSNSNKGGSEEAADASVVK